MTDSNINSLLNNEEEKDETLLDTTQIKSNTESLLDRIEQKSFTPNLDQNIFKTQAKVVDFFDNKFLGNQRSFEEILENRSRIANEGVKKKEETDKQITKTATSQVIRGAITGPLRAINETVEFADDIYDYLAGNPYDNNDLIDTSNFEREDDGAFYQIPQAITQFLLPMGIFTKGLKGIKNPWTRSLVAGFLTDFVVEDPFEQNLYNMVDSYEGMLEPVVDILKMPASIFKAEDDISPIEARLRKAFGGAVIGEALTGLSVGLKAFRNSKLAPEALRTLEAKQRLKFKDLGIDQAGNELLDEKVIDLIKPLNVKQTSTDQNLFSSSTRLNLPDTRGEGKFYHGAASDIELVEGGEFGKGVENLYGDGFYTTEDLVTAAKYQKKNRVKGKKTSGVVYEVTEKQPVNFFDLDAPASPEKIEQIRRIFSFDDDDYADIIDRVLDDVGPDPSIGKIYDQIKIYSNNRGLSAATTSDIFSSFTEELQNEGFGGLTHQGGKKAGKGKRLHQVRIYFDPANSLTINKVNFDDILKTPRVGEKIESTFNPRITGGGIQSLRESLLNLSEYFRDTDEFGQWTRSVSLRDMFNASQRQTRKQALEAARFLLQEFGPIKRTRNGNLINNPRYLPATTISVNQMMNKNGEEVYNLSVALHNAIVTKNLDAIKEIRSDFIEETKVLKGLVYLNKGVGALTSQSLGARRAAGGLRDAKTTAQDFGVRSSTEDIDSINRNFIEDTGADEIDETFNKIFDLVEKGDEEAALSLTRLTKYLHIAGGNPEVLKKMIKKGFIERGVEITNEIYINSILSGPPTHVVNILSTGLNTLIKPLTQSAGAFKVTATDSFGKKVFRPEFNTEEFIKGWKQFIYMYQSLGDAFNVAGKAFKVNENVLDRAAMVQDARRVSRNINGQDVTNFADSNALTRNAIKPFIDFTNADAWLPSIYNNFRRINSFGSRLLITEDEFYKQVNFRAYVKADAWEKGVKAGKTGNALTEYIEQQSNKVFDIVDTGSTKGLPPSITDLYKKAKDYAAEVTFTKDLPQDGFGKTIQNFANHPFGRLIVPFVRTPINIFKTQLKFIPGFNYALLGEYRRALKSTDPSVAARARGEMYLGGGFTSMALLLARDIDNPMAEVSFTGGGPNTVGFGDVIEQNRLLVKQKRAEGWQPYSFRFLVRDKNGEVVMTKSGKPKYKYISYKRLDPWSGIFMLLGDYADIEGQIGQQQRNDFAVAMTVAIARNLTDRTFVSGITEFAEAIHNPFKLQSLLSRRVANIVNPVSSFGRSVNKAIDKTKLDTSFYPKGSEEMFTGVRSFLNELAKTVPLYNADLQPDRNWLTGAVIEYPNGVGPDIFDVLNPFTATNTKDNLVLTVINDLNISLQPPKKFFFREQGVEGTGIELDNDQYADYIKHLAFDTKINGKRLIVKLFEELNKPQNKAFYQTALGQNIDADDARLKMQIQDNARAEIASLIREEVTKYKKEARKRWFKKPENRKIYSDYQDKLRIINDNTTKATIKNYNKNIVDVNQN